MVGEPGFDCSDGSAPAANDNSDLQPCTRELSDVPSEPASINRRRRNAKRVNAANDNPAQNDSRSIYLVSDASWPSHTLKGEADMIRRLLGNTFWEIMRSEKR